LVAVGHPETGDGVEDRIQTYFELRAGVFSPLSASSTTWNLSFAEYRPRRFRMKSPSLEVPEDDFTKPDMVVQFGLPPFPTFFRPSPAIE
jgi:hypothetical protein